MNSSRLVALGSNDDGWGPKKGKSKYCALHRVPYGARRWRDHTKLKCCAISSLGVVLCCAACSPPPPSHGSKTRRVLIDLAFTSDRMVNRKRRAAARSKPNLYTQQPTNSQEENATLTDTNTHAARGWSIYLSIYLAGASPNPSGGSGATVVPPIGGGHVAHGEEAENAEAGDVRELFHTPILRKITLCL